MGRWTGGRVEAFSQPPTYPKSARGYSGWGHWRQPTAPTRPPVHLSSLSFSAAGENTTGCVVEAKGGRVGGQVGTTRPPVHPSTRRPPLTRAAAPRSATLTRRARSTTRCDADLSTATLDACASTGRSTGAAIVDAPNREMDELRSSTDFTWVPGFSWENEYQIARERGVRIVDFREEHWLSSMWDAVTSIQRAKTWDELYEGEAVLDQHIQRYRAAARDAGRSCQHVGGVVLECRRVARLTTDGWQPERPALRQRRPRHQKSHA
jgi:hypothetical protein